MAHMTNMTYDRLKVTALVAAPVIVFVGALLNIWNVPYTSEITASLAALDVLLGAIVKVASDNYNKTAADEPSFD